MRRALLLASSALALSASPSYASSLDFMLAPGASVAVGDHYIELGNLKREEKLFIGSTTRWDPVARLYSSQQGVAGEFWRFGRWSARATGMGGLALGGRNGFTLGMTLEGGALVMRHGRHFGGFLGPHLEGLWLPIGNGGARGNGEVIGGFLIPAGEATIWLSGGLGAAYENDGRFTNTLSGVVGVHFGGD